MMTLKFIKYCEDSSQLAESSSKYYILDITIVLSIYKLRTFSCEFFSHNCYHQRVSNFFVFSFIPDKLLQLSLLIHFTFPTLLQQNVSGLCWCYNQEFIKSSLLGAAHLPSLLYQTTMWTNIFNFYS